MKILGIDASTTTIGICVLDCATDPPAILHLSYYKPHSVLQPKPKPKKKIKKTKTPDEKLQETHDLFQMLSCVRTFIINVINQWNPDIVALEDIAKFMAGKSSAQTMTLLASLNRTVGTAAYDQGKCPILFNCLSIRHKIKLTKELPEKEQVPEVLATRLGISFPYAYTVKGKIMTESYDMADALAVALTALYIQRK